jgi:hypothetical protein
MFVRRSFPQRVVYSWRSFAVSAGALGLAMLVYVFVHHATYASASELPLAASTAKSPADFNWRQSPSSSLNSPGKNSVTLDACPPGVLTNEPWYYIYISDAGTSEAVRVTGGSCKGDGRRGTLEFTAAKAHFQGYAIGSASSGIQEASIAARYAPTNPTGIPQSGKVVIPPGEYDVWAPISIRASGQTVDFSGAVLNCYTANDACVFVGDHSVSTMFENITLLAPRGRPMMIAGTKPFIEVNANQTRIFNITTRQPPKGASFGSYIQVDDDQAFLLDGMDTNLGGGGVTCNPTYCGAFISAPGPFNHWSAVGWLKHLNLSLQCAGKGVDWVSGNGLRISDSVIQGWSVFGVRVSNQRGGYAGLVTENVYFEASPMCKASSPYGNVGSAGIIAEGAHVKTSGVGNQANGVLPNWGAASGSRDSLYWVVPVHATFGDGVPLPAGYALHDSSATITGVFPRIAGASSYKILRMEWDQSSTRPYPEGTGNYLLTTVQQSSCATLTCQFTDNGGALASYTNVGEGFSAAIYLPRLDFWPGAIVLSPGEDLSRNSYTNLFPPLRADVIAVGGVVSVLPSTAISGVADVIAGSPATPPAAATIEAIHTNGIGLLPAATILKAANLPQTSETGHKGRLNFGHRGQGGGFTPLITMGDSNWGKTWATATHRPAADVNDFDLGYEGNIDVSYSRAQNEIREYVGKLPDGHPQEKLTAAAKTFGVPVTINGDLTVTGKCTGCGGIANPAVGSGAARGVSLTNQSASIATANLCGTAACTAGQYRVSYYVDSTTMCPSPGNASVSLTVNWKDETGARTMKVPLWGTGISGGTALSLGSTQNFGSGSISLWSAGNAAISYATAYAGCTGSSGSYALRIAIEKVQ